MRTEHLHQSVLGIAMVNTMQVTLRTSAGQG